MLLLLQYYKAEDKYGYEKKDYYDKKDEVRQQPMA